MNLLQNQAGCKLADAARQRGYIIFNWDEPAMSKTQDIIREIKKLEKELLLEIQKKEEKFFYTVKKRKVYFDEDRKKHHRQRASKIHSYLLASPPITFLIAPVAWLCIIPAVFMDLVISFYQLICFSACGIPKVKRKDYIAIDHHSLGYLNLIEKVNCVYCSYFNGLIAYVQEIAARTEQHWCPIKHARKLSNIHSRYHKYMEYGDDEDFQKRFEKISCDFDDLAEESGDQPGHKE
jgi:hypothetical protein